MGEQLSQVPAEMQGNQEALAQAMNEVRQQQIDSMVNNTLTELSLGKADSPLFSAVDPKYMGRIKDSVLPEMSSQLQDQELDGAEKKGYEPQSEDAKKAMWYLNHKAEELVGGAEPVDEASFFEGNNPEPAPAAAEQASTDADAGSLPNPETPVVINETNKLPDPLPLPDEKDRVETSEEFDRLNLSLVSDEKLLKMLDEEHQLVAEDFHVGKRADESELERIYDLIREDARRRQVKNPDHTGPDEAVEIFKRDYDSHFTKTEPDHDVLRDALDRVPDIEDSSLGEDIEELTREPNYEELNSMMDPEVISRFIAARNRYAKATADRRRVNFGKNKELEAARKEYEEARNFVGGIMAVRMHERGASKVDLKNFAIAGAVYETYDLETAIMNARTEMADGKKLARFYSWWAQNNGKFFSKAGFKGAVKKSGVMAAVGLPLGIAAGAAGAFVLGPVAGAVAAGVLARGVAKGLASGRISKNAEAKTVAEAQADAHFTATEEYLNNLGDVTAAEINTNMLTGQVDRRTKNELWRNRRRLGASAFMGAAGGLAGAVVGNQLHDYISDRFNGGGSGSVEVTSPSTTSVARPTQPLGPQPGTLPSGSGTTTDVVIPGGSSTNELPEINTTKPDVASNALDQVYSDKLHSATGDYPWTRAMNVFDGNEAQSNDFVRSMSDKAAQSGHNVVWSNNGMNLTIDGRGMGGLQDTNYVWNILVEEAEKAGKQLPGTL